MDSRISAAAGKARQARKTRQTRQITYIGLITALSVVASLLESRFPLPFPGLRIGIGNIFLLTALTLFGARAAAAVAVLRVGLVFLLSGNVFAAACSIAGVLCSLPLSVVLYARHREAFSLPAISTAAAVVFNVGQLAAVVLMTGERALWFYLPVLIATGAATGFAVGGAADALQARIRKIWSVNDASNGRHAG